MQYQNTLSHKNHQYKARTAQYKPVQPPDTRRLLSAACALLALAVPSAQTGSRGDTPPPPASQTSASPNATDNYRASLTNTLHWGHFPLKVAFVNGMTSGSQDLDRLATRGFDQWTTATHGVVRYDVIRSREDADIVVMYNVIASRPGNGEQLGQTGFNYNPRRMLLNRASMHLNVWENMTRGDLYRFQNTAAHEFGHALGINGHSPDPDDLMYFSSSSAKGVTARDVNTLSPAYNIFNRYPERYDRVDKSDRVEKNDKNTP